METPHDNHLPRCQVVPLPGNQVSIQLDGQERLRWHFDPTYPRPFFFPLSGPSGESLVRMGHPGAPDHDHHRGIWFAHHDVMGHNFWSDQTATRIEQTEWLCYEDGENEARMAVKLGWFDGHDPRALVRQQLVVAARPLDDAETLVEVQSTFVPTAGEIQFGTSNYGLMGVRVAKGISAHFGGGTIRDSEGRQGETAIFGQRARWMDYSGPVTRAHHPRVEGITYFDHPDNPRYPASWHVRSDGWMVASVCMHGPLTASQNAPLTLRYLLHAHQGQASPDRADRLAAEFAQRGRLIVRKSRRPHLAYEMQRLDDD